MKGMACRSDDNKRRKRYLSCQPRMNYQYSQGMHYFPLWKIWQNPMAAEVGSTKKSCGKLLNCKH